MSKRIHDYYHSIVERDKVEEKEFNIREQDKYFVCRLNSSLKYAYKNLISQLNQQKSEEESATD